MRIIVARLDKEGNVVKHASLGDIPPKVYENLLKRASDFARANVFTANLTGKQELKSVTLEFSDCSLSIVNRNGGILAIITMKEEALSAS